ncbi:MAG: biopolymer transport protein ExbD [Verrucomicrobiales bacterium]|jgi:biopolymer transport protein ExbD
MPNFRKKDRDAPEIDVSAFSDIAFLLIIFFILTTTFEQFIGNTVEIPAGAPSEQSAEEDKQTTIVLDADKILFNEENQAISIGDLKARLRALKLASKKEDMEKMVLVEATDEVVYDRYFTVVNAIAEAGGVLAIIEREGEE